VSRSLDETMQETHSRHAAKIKIGGIKVSPELVQFNLFSTFSSGPAGYSLLRRMADGGINLTFLTRDATDSGTACSFCVTRNDAVRVKRMMEQADIADEKVKILAPVGTISLFPHHNSFTVLGAVIRVLGKAGIPVHTLCTSLSSVAVSIDYGFLGATVEELKKIFDLPCNHAPFFADLDLHPTLR